MVSICSVPSSGDTENGRDVVPALTELTVWWGDRHTDSHKHSVVGSHVHSLPCLKEDLESSSTVWFLERKTGRPGTRKTRVGNQGEATGRATQNACVEVLDIRLKGATNLALSFLAAKEKGETRVRQAVHRMQDKSKLGKELPQEFVTPPPLRMSLRKSY